MSFWKELGLDPTGDTAAIRRAYARRLKVTQPEDDPEGFQRLREAYEMAMRHAAYQQDDKEEGEEALADGGPAYDARPIGDPQPAYSPSPDDIESARQRSAIETDGEAMISDLMSDDPARWADARGKLDSILASPALDSIELRATVEAMLAHHIARFIPRSDGLIEPAAEYFGWNASDYSQATDAVAWVMERRRTIALVEAMRWEDHDFHVGWMALTDADATPWRRRLAAQRPATRRQVRQLLEFAAHDQLLQADMAENAVAWWQAYLSGPRIEDSGGAILLCLILAALGLGGITWTRELHLSDWIAPALGGAVLAGLFQALFVRRRLAGWMAKRRIGDRWWFFPLLVLPLAGGLVPIGTAGSLSLIFATMALLSFQDAWLAAWRTAGYNFWWKDAGGVTGFAVAIFFSFGTLQMAQVPQWGIIMLGFVVGWCRGEERAMAYLNGMRVGARRSLLIVAALLIGLAVGFAVSRGDPALGYQAVILVGAGALPLSFGVAFETADGLRQILLIAIRVLLIAAIIMLKSSMLAYPVAPPVVQKPLPPPVPDCSAMPEAKPGEGLQPPRPCGDTSKWTNWADYPEAAARRGAEGAVSLAGTITAAGRLSDCHVLKGSGHADLDAATCPLLESRGRWLPGRDGKGKAIDTPFRVRFRWTIQDARTGA